MQSKQHVMHRLMAGGGGCNTQADMAGDMEETDGEDCHEWKPMTVDHQERSTRRSGVRSAMHAASQLPGREATDVADAPASES